MSSCVLPANFPVPICSQELHLPLHESRVHAGFASPAEEFNRRLDLSSILVAHPQATHIMRIRGQSMIDFGFFDDDLALVDKALAATAKHRQIVVAELDGEFVIKRLYKLNGIIKLQAGNKTYPDIIPKSGQSLSIWGVVTSTIRQFERW